MKFFIGLRNALLFELVVALLIIVGCQVARAQSLPDAPSRVIDKQFVAFTSAAIGSAAFDAWSTNRNLDHGYIEQNVFLGKRPSKVSVWALCMGESVGWSVAAYYVKRATRRSNSKFVRNTWMFFPALSFSGHLRGGIHNVSIYDPVKYPMPHRPTGLFPLTGPFN